jgi:anti-anti-sigma regulatory factor
MFLRMESEAGLLHLQARANLTIYEAAQARDALLAIDDGALPTTCVLDLAAVEELDYAGVQILLAWQRHLAQAGTTLQLAGVGEPLREVLALLQLDAQLLLQD